MSRSLGACFLFHTPSGASAWTAEDAAKHHAEEESRASREREETLDGWQSTVACVWKVNKARTAPVPVFVGHDNVDPRTGACRALDGVPIGALSIIRVDFCSELARSRLNTGVHPRVSSVGSPFSDAFGRATSAEQGALFPRDLFAQVFAQCATRLRDGGALIAGVAVDEGCDDADPAAAATPKALLKIAEDSGLCIVRSKFFPSAASVAFVAVHDPTPGCSLMRLFEAALSETEARCAADRRAADGRGGRRGRENEKQG